MVRFYCDATKANMAFVKFAKKSVKATAIVFITDGCHQGILKGEVSMYCWPVWLVWNQQYDNGQCLFLFTKQTNPNQSDRRSTVQWYFPPLVFPCATINKSSDLNLIKLFMRYLHQYQRISLRFGLKVGQWWH